MMKSAGLSIKQKTRLKTISINDLNNALLSAQLTSGPLEHVTIYLPARAHYHPDTSMQLL